MEGVEGLFRDNDHKPPSLHEERLDRSFVLGMIVQDIFIASSGFVSGRATNDDGRSRITVTLNLYHFVCLLLSNQPDQSPTIARED